MKKHAQFLLIASALGIVTASAESDCVALSQTVSLEVAADQSNLLEIVSKQVAANPSCACEVVKAAIKASKADAKLVASIVEAAATAAPDQMRLISQCAIATAPDAASAVQAVVAKLDPNSGESAKTEYSGKAPAEAAAPTWNPLDFPSDSSSQVGPRPGTNGGSNIIRPGLVFDTPPLIDIPVVTSPNP